MPSARKTVVARCLSLAVVCLLLAAPARGAEAAAPAAAAEDGITLLRQELAAKPAAPGYIRLGYLLIKKGNPDQALLAFDEAIRLNPRSHDALCGKGIAQVRKGNLDTAEQLFRDALTANPNPVRVHYELGLLYEKRGNIDKALAEYKEGLKKYQEGRR